MMHWDQKEEIIRMPLRLCAWWQRNGDTTDKTESLETGVVWEEEGGFGLYAYWAGSIGFDLGDIRHLGEYWEVVLITTTINFYL